MSDLPVKAETPQTDFSFRVREQNLRRLKEETFDFLIIGGGITGAGVARDAARRGLKVALVERSDFAVGTSSRSSKLIHGGLRYLENFEFGLVFEALSERANLLRTAPHMVRPLKFYFPVYQGDANGRFVLMCGMWLYDILSLFRAPGFHKSLSRRRMLKEIPFLKKQGLQGGFSYYDASMWDDVMVVEVMKSAAQSDAVIANYAEALLPIWTKTPRGDKISGFKVRDTLNPQGGEFEVKAHRTIVCAGPWTDELGQRMSREWKSWLSPSKGVHLIFDLKRIPIQGAMVMSHPVDGRIAFVIPRPDFGNGVVVVGTTDGPSPAEPSLADVGRDDVDYLLDLLNRYFPDLEVKASDILSAYVGVRPLVGGDDASIEKLQKVSREHHIDVGPGRTTVVAGGKYTTYRKMAEEIVEFTLERWSADSERERESQPPTSLRNPYTREAMNPHATPEAIAQAKLLAASKKMELPRELLERYGANALVVRELALKDPAPELAWPEGFPDLGAQLRYCMRYEMTLHLRDFYFRRLPLYASRADHGLPWAEALSHIWAEELGKDVTDRIRELELLRKEIAERSSWQSKLK